MGVESGTCLLSWDFAEDAGYVAVSLIKSDKSVEVINIFKDGEARELVEKVLAQGDEE